MKLFTDLRDRLKTDKKVLFLIVLFVAGIILFALSGNTSARNKTEEPEVYGICEQMESRLERRAEKLLGGVKGVGKVRVLVTVERLEEHAFAQDTSLAGANEKSENKYVIVERNGEKTGLTLSVSAPVVRGIAVCCEGGGSALIKKEIVSLLSAAFGIGANKIGVSELAK